MRNRLVCFFLAVLMLSGGIPIGEAKAENVNLIENSGFETLSPSTGFPAEWTTFNGWIREPIGTSKICQVLSTTNPHSGTYCAKIWINWAGNYPSVNYRVNDVVPGNIYALSYFARADITPNTYFAVQMDFQKEKEDGTYTTVSSQKTLYSSPGSDWTEYRQEFRLWEGGTYDSILLRFKLFGQGSVSIDDVFFGCTAEKPKYTLDTDAVFYYSDDTTDVEATVTDESGLCGTVSLTLKEGTKTLLVKESIAFTDGKATFCFPLAALEKEKTSYTVEVTVTNSEGTVTLTEDIYKYPRPSRLRADGTYVLNGKTVVPVMAHGIAVGEYEKAKEIGINVVTASYWYADLDPEGFKRIDSLLSALHEADMLCILGLYRRMLPSGHSANRSNTAKIVSYIKSHKYKDHIFAYSMMDEPIQNDRPAGDVLLEWGYKQIRDLDSEIPVLTVDAHNSEKETFRVTKFCDIYSCDAYYAGNGPVASWPGEIVKLSVDAAAKSKRTVYHLTQAFDWKGRTVAEEETTFPTGDEIVHMLCQAFLAGAKGIGYYTITGAAEDQEGNTLALYETDRWPVLKAFAEGNLPILSEYFGEGKHEFVSNIKADGYSSEVWNKNETLYILLLNNTDMVQEAQISLPFTTFTLAKQGQEHYRTCEGGTFTYSLDGREAVLLEAEEIGKLKYFKEDGSAVQDPVAGEVTRARIILPQGTDARIFFAGYTDTLKTEVVSIMVLRRVQGTYVDTYSAEFTTSQTVKHFDWYAWDNKLRPLK